MPAFSLNVYESHVARREDALYGEQVPNIFLQSGSKLDRPLRRSSTFYFTQNVVLWERNFDQNKQRQIQEKKRSEL